MSHKQTVSSAPAEAKILPSLENLIDQTVFVWAWKYRQQRLCKFSRAKLTLKVETFVPEAMSHNKTSLSSPAEASNRPSGETPKL